MILSRSEDTSKFYKEYGRFSGYFKKSEGYIVKTKRKKELTKEEQEAIKNDVRYCLHWGCEKTYNEFDNVDKKPCRYHPGRWDFGPTGETMTQVMQDKSARLWRPHWTCCRKKWTAQGCVKGIHNGPSIKETKGDVKKYKWPDCRAQIYFKKRVSPHWNEFMEKHVVPTMRPVEEVFDYFVKTKGSEGVILLLLLENTYDPTPNIIGSIEASSISSFGRSNLSFQIFASNQW